MNYIRKHKNKLLIIVSILLVIPFIFNIGLLYDDPFSMGMINHTYADIIKLTTLDVHPPLYYFILKLFLSITTFWTTNIFIKIVFARILSVIFALISLNYIIKILNTFNINFNKYLTTLIFIISPVIFGLDQQAAHIRMYSMSTALTIIVVYYLITFIKTNKLSNLVIVSVFSSLTLYTNYYFGLIAGLYILSAIIYELYKKEYNYSIQLMLSGIISLFMFIPWMPNLLAQINTSDSHSIQSFTTTSKIAILEYLIFMIIIFISFIINKGISKKISYFMYSSFATSIIIFILNIKMYPVSVSLRYTSTPLILLIILSIALNTKYQRVSKHTANNVVVTLMIILISITFIKSFKNEIMQYNVPSINFINKFNRVKQNNSKEINTNNYDINNFAWKNQGGNSIYLMSINKNISDKHYTNVYYAVGNGDTNLFHKIFPNIEHYYTKK